MNTIYDPGYKGFRTFRCSECLQEAPYIKPFPHIEGCVKPELLKVLGERLARAVVFFSIIKWPSPLAISVEELEDKFPEVLVKARKYWQWLEEDPREVRRQRFFFEHLEGAEQKLLPEMLLVPRKPTVRETQSSGQAQRSSWPWRNRA